MEIETTASQSRNIQTNGAPRTSYIPEDMIEEIFLQLPVKSLCRFRLVTKPWRSLIDSNHFIRKHLQYSTRNPSLEHHRVLLASHHVSSRYANSAHRRVLIATRQASLSHCSLLSLFNPEDVHSVERTIPTDVPLNSISLVGCCDGLVCALLYNQHLILWNPSTRIFKNLPRTCEYMQRVRLTGTTCYGFGYDKSSEDYKVFWCVSFDNKSAYTVYSLKTDSWKRPNVVHNSLRCWGQGKLACGKLHWQGTYTDSSGDYRWKIVSFDLSREAYGTVEKPCFSQRGFWSLLGEIGGCISVVCCYITRIHVWVMREYGVKESWERVIDVQIPPWSSVPLVPLCVGPEGEILIKQGRNIMIYYEDYWFWWEGDILRMLDEADIYVESLVSLFP